MRKIYLYFLFLSVIAVQFYAQPFVDPLNFTSRYCQTAYKDGVLGNNQTSDYNLNIFLPKEFKNGHTFILRFGAENIFSRYTNSGYSYSTNLYSLSMPIGIQLLTKNKKWKGLFLVIPKVNSDFIDDLSQDFQIASITMGTYVKHENLKFKLGLYYSSEFWGNFFMPLVGMDWKINNHWSMYGVMPSNYRMEYRFNNRLYVGAGFKAFQRSYKLSKKYNNDFVWVKDSQIKLFIDYFIYRKIIIFGDVSYGVPYNRIRYTDKHTVNYKSDLLFAPVKNTLLFSIGIAYRIRLDMQSPLLPNE